MKKAKPTAAELLADKLKAIVPERWEATVCLCVNMEDVYGDAPEKTLLVPTCELFREHRLAKTLETLRSQARELGAKIKSMGYAAAVDGASVYVNPVKP